MNIVRYKEHRRKLEEEAPKYREVCSRCFQPGFGCYCSSIQQFDPQIEFVILIHPIEVRRRIATGRMSHLCLKNSSLIMGQDFTRNKLINEVIGDQERESVILYPGPRSINLSDLPEAERIKLFPRNKILTVFVIDGTWATAKKMIRQSQNINALPRICFTPERPSNFRVRKQPHEGCYSTIEAIHQTIGLLGPGRGFDVKSREHDKLLKVFDLMVERQISFINESLKTGRATYRRVRRSISAK